MDQVLSNIKKSCHVGVPIIFATCCLININLVLICLQGHIIGDNFSHFLKSFYRKQIHLQKTITVRYLEPKQAQMYQRAMHFLLTSARRRWLLAEKPAALNHDAMSSESGLFGLYVTVIDL